MKKQLTIPLLTLVMCCVGCAQDTPTSTLQGVVIEHENMVSLQADTVKILNSAEAKVVRESGLMGVQGGAHVKFLQDGKQEVLLPLPQLSDHQIPISYAITTTPPAAAAEYRIWERVADNVVVRIQLTGQRNQEVQIDWASVVLITDNVVSPNSARPDEYMSATSCVQSTDAEMTQLTKELWPENGQITDYAANIQQFIRQMTPKSRPRSLDAKGILQSGANGICTANANLAAALLRAQGIACRSVAVIPPNGQRLEMHRVVEYFDDGHWSAFDPSSLCSEIPLEPWHNVIVAKTTLSDENTAMKPRMGAMVGSPYGQELEVLSPGISLWGQDFFWTIAQPIAAFDADQESVRLAVEAWQRFLADGSLSQNQINAAQANSSEEFLKFLKE